jgi:hypothetical protein
MVNGETGSERAKSATCALGDLAAGALAVQP